MEQVFDAISYCKGSTVVNMVHAILGEQFCIYNCGVIAWLLVSNAALMYVHFLFWPASIQFRSGFRQTDIFLTGKEKFQEGLQLYMQRHAYGNTETVDLWNAWSEVWG